MKDIYNEQYYTMFDCSKQIENSLESFALITLYDRESNSYSQKEVRMKDKTLADLLQSQTPDMVSVTVYYRKVGLIHDIEVFGKPEYVGRTIYFGTIESVGKYNSQNLKSLDLPLDQQIVLLDCGEVLTEFEPASDTSFNVLNLFRKAEDKIRTH